MHCSRVSCVAQVGCRWYTLSSNGAPGDGRGWTGQPRNRRIRFRSHIFYEVPDDFLTTLVRNLSSTAGHHDHRYFRCLPPICWPQFAHRHGRGKQLGRYSIQVSSPAPQNYWTLVSDDLIAHGRNSGQYTDTFKCNIEVAGKVCGAERSLIHCKDKAVSTTNLIVHVESMSKKCVSHAALDGILKDASPNYVNVNGEKQKMHTFAGISSMLSVSEVWKNKST